MLRILNFGMYYKYGLVENDAGAVAEIDYQELTKVDYYTTTKIQDLTLSNNSANNEV